MYLALREMSVRAPDCSVMTIAPGEEVPDFRTWPTWTQQAMLQEQQVRWAPEGLAPHEEKAAARVVDQRIPDRVLGPPARAPEPDLGPELYVPGQKPHLDREPEVLRATAVDGEAKPLRKKRAKLIELAEPAGPSPVFVEPPKPGLKPTVDDAIDNTILVPQRAPALNDGVQVSVEPVRKSGAHDCPSCGKQGFKDFAGLRIHMAKAHKVTD